MTAVALRIVRPAHGAAFVGSATVVLEGEVVQRPAELAGIPLYFRWYSSLWRGGPPPQTSINVPAFSDPASPLTPPLKVGTHVLTLAASDRPGEAREDQDATRHGGVTGGAEGDAPCVIHVLVANYVEPAENATVSRANPRLAAEAPVLWKKAEYAERNGLRYRWRFEPRVAGGRPVWLEPAVAALELDLEGLVPAVRYTGPLPATVPLGPATLHLRVERIDNPAVGAETARPVVIAA